MTAGEARSLAKQKDTKVAAVMHEWKAGRLRSWRGKGKPGPVVTDQRQAVAIALSQARKEGER